MSVTINRNADDQEFDDVVETLLAAEKARVIPSFNSNRKEVGLFLS